MAARLAHATTLDRTADVARLVPAGGLVVAVTDDGADPRYAAVREAAAELAAEAHGKLLLFYAPRGRSGSGVRPRLFFPGLRGPDGGTGRPHTGSRRRDLLAHEAAAIRARGVGVAVWLAGRAGATGLAEAVSLTHAAVVLVPAESSRPGIIRRTLDYQAAKIAAPVVAVGRDGDLTLVPPLGGRRPALVPATAAALEAIGPGGPSIVARG